MNNTEFIYDVAFSFCSEDEKIARDVNDLLTDRYMTFLYSKKQEHLVGKDGMDEFSIVFAKQARVVVVFYQEKYGIKGYTMIEENAIKQRILDEGLDFVIYVPIGKTKQGPKYYPSSRLWFNYERFGAEGLMLVIEQKIVELGGEQIAISAIEKAKKIKRIKDYELKLKNYKSHQTYITDGWKEFNQLKELTIKKFQEVQEHIDEIVSFLTENDNYIVYRYHNSQIDITWLKGLKYTIEEPILKVNLVRLASNNDVFNPGIEKRIVKAYEYIFTKNMQWENVWKEKSKSNLNIFTSEGLSDIVVNLFFDFIQKPEKFENHRGGFF